MLALAKENTCVVVFSRDWRVEILRRLQTPVWKKEHNRPLERGRRSIVFRTSAVASTFLYAVDSNRFRQKSLAIAHARRYNTWRNAIRKGVR